MKTFQKKLNAFESIIVAFIIFIAIFLFLSIPAFFNYESIKDELKKNIYKDLKIYINNLSEINYRFYPAPHLVIEKADLNLEKNDKLISELNNLQVYVSLSKLYSNKKIEIRKIKIENSNFYLDKNSILSFKDHFQKKINKSIQIINSNFFYKDKDEQINAISPIKNLNYFIDFNSRVKKLKIKGNLFDVPYNFIWSKNYNKPNFSNLTINFKNPNFRIENESEKIPEDDHKKGFTKIKYLNEKIYFQYTYNNEMIKFKTAKKNINKVEFDGTIRLNPFYFEIDTVLKKQKIDFIINKIMFYLDEYKTSIHPNFNGHLNIKFEDINNNFVKSGLLQVNFKKPNLKIVNKDFDINNIGKGHIEEIEFVENYGSLFFKSKINIDILNQEEFYRKFSIPKKNRINLKNIYLEIEKNLEENKYSMLNIKINNNFKKNIIDKKNDETIKYDFSNIQQLRKILSKEFKNFTVD